MSHADDWPGRRGQRPVRTPYDLGRELALRSAPLVDGAAEEMERRLATIATAAGRIQALPPAIQNREAAVLLRCPVRRELLARIFRLASGELLTIPLGRLFMSGTWCAPTPWLLASQPERDEDLVSVRGRCCARPHRVPAGALRAAAARGARGVTVLAIG